jgi:hypothetical protein
MTKLAKFENNNFTVIKELSDDETKNYDNLIRYIELFDFILNVTKSFVINFEEYESVKNQVLMGNRSTMLDKYNIIVTVQNLLSSFRGYIDTFAHTLSQEFAKDSDIFIFFKAAKSERFDACKSYRLIEAIRNYSQHVGVPIDSLRTSYKENNRQLELIIKRSTITESDFLSKKKAKDIEENFEEEIDLNVHLMVMMGELSLIHDKVIEHIIDEDRISEINGIKTKLQEEGSSLLLLEYLGEGKDIVLQLRFFAFENFERNVNNAREALMLFDRVD